MRVEQAIYGEVQGRGHGLRASSTEGRIATEIAPKLDLPDAVPAGVLAWSPFVRGFPIGDHYVLARTFLDSSASRGGMVLSHALIISLADICEVKSLAPVFERLASSPADCSDSVSTLELDVNSRKRLPAADLTGAANALTDQGAPPVVRLGIEGFEHLVDSLWQNFWPALRRTFAFRLSFGPSDVVEQPLPTLVCTPKQLQARWVKYHVVNPDDQEPKSEASGVISGQRDAMPILTLAADLGLEVQSLKELTRLERLRRLLVGSGGFDDLLAAVRLIDGLSNDPTIGGGKKDEVIKRFIAEVPRATCRQLLPVRNLALAGFAHTEPLWTAVEDLVSNMNYAADDDRDLTELILAAADMHVALLPWRAAVKAGVAAAARRETRTLFQAAWRWAERSQAAFAAVIGILPAEPSIEQRFADEAPTKLKGTAPDGLLVPLLTKRWLTAHGAVLAATQPPLEAARQQLKVDKDGSNIAGLRSALRHATPAQTLECTVALKSPRLVSLCVDVALDHPQILAGIRCEDATEQKVWGVAIGKSPSLCSAPSNAIGARDTVLAQLANGQPVDVNLLEALGGTPLADLSAAPDRARLWALLPTSRRNAFLQATAIGWLNAAARGVAPTSPEPDLEAAILNSEGLQSTLETQSVAVEARLAIIGALPLPEDRFVTWLDSLLRGLPSMPQPIAEQLGTLMANRRWARAAKHLADRYAAHRNDLLPGLRICSDMLGIFTRWKLGVSKPSIAEKWNAFEEEARDLYPSGPDTNELWSRAGGKNADLPQFQNGSARWHKSLNSMRQGGGPTARELLAVMVADFPGNEKLRFYASDSDIVGWR
jgi:hypothetical protein